MIPTKSLLRILSSLTVRCRYVLGSLDRKNAIVNMRTACRWWAFGSKRPWPGHASQVQARLG